MTKKQKKMLIRIIAAAVLLALAALLPPVRVPFGIPLLTSRLDGDLFALAPIWLYLAAYFTIGWDILWKAIRNIGHGQVFDENFLMCVATVGALVLGETSEAVGVMLFYQVGELFQSVAVGRSRQSIAQLMDIRPDTANVERDGQIIEVDPDEVAVGEIIVIRPGEKVPLDGVVIEGASSLNTAALTGESAPRDVGVGGELLSGCVNVTGLLKARTTRAFGQSTVAKILDLVENAAAKKARAENFITRFAKYYTPCVVFAALALAVIRTAGIPVAAPSGNLSGRPSPTCARHMLEDMDGKIEAILDDGPCAVGVESTIIDLTVIPPRLLRPGGVTLEELEETLGEVEVDEAVRRLMAPGEQPKAPGMKYRHYAPKAPVTVVKGEPSCTAAYIQLKLQQGSGVICFDEFKDSFPDHPVETIGPAADPAAQARHIFEALRAFDHLDVTDIWAQSPSDEGIGLAVTNRLNKAAGFHIVEL